MHILTGDATKQPGGTLTDGTTKQPSSCMHILTGDTTKQLLGYIHISEDAF